MSNLSPLPAQGDTSWYDYAQSLHTEVERLDEDKTNVYVITDGSNPAPGSAPGIIIRPAN